MSSHMISVIIVVAVKLYLLFPFQTLYPNQVLSAPLPPPEYFSVGHSDQEDNDFDGEEEPLSLTESSNDGDTMREEELLSAPLPPLKPHPLTTLQCADVHRESKCISCCAIG